MTPKQPGGAAPSTGLRPVPLPRSAHAGLGRMALPAPAISYLMKRSGMEEGDHAKGRPKDARPSGRAMAWWRGAYLEDGRS